MNMGPCNVIMGQRSVYRGPCNVIIGPWNVNSGLRNVNRRP